MNFNVSEKDVLDIRAEIARKGLTVEDLKKVPVEVGLQTETGFPHKGTLDYSAPTLNQSTGTLAARAIFQNPNNVLLPGYFVRVRVPLGEAKEQLLVPDVALGSDQGGRYLLVLNKDDVVEQRKIEDRSDRRYDARHREGACGGRSRRRRRPSARNSRPEGRPADADSLQRARARAGALTERHDLEILH